MLMHVFFFPADGFGAEYGGEGGVLGRYLRESWNEI